MSLDVVRRVGHLGVPFKLDRSARSAHSTLQAPESLQLRALPLPVHDPWQVGPQGLSGLRRLCKALDRQEHVDPRGKLQVQKP